MFLINPYILQASGNPLWNDLLAYYTADNTPNDALGTYNGTLTNGATYGTGIINNGFSLDGVNDYVDFGNNLDNDGTNSVSFSCWVYITSVSSFQSIISKMVSDITGYKIYYSGGYIYFRISQNNTNAVIKRNDTILSGNTWYHVVVTYDGSKTAAGVNIYIDDSLATSTISKDTFTGSSANAGNLTIASTTNPLGGIIDELGIWNRELSASEVTELYNSGAGLQY
jgi:hypothetical protein